MLFRVGMLMIMLALMMGESDMLIVPVVLFAAGAVLVGIGRRREARNGKDNTKTARS